MDSSSSSQLSIKNMTKAEREAKCAELYEKYGKKFAEKAENPDEETVYVEIDGKMVPLTDDVDTTDIMAQFDSSKDIKKDHQFYMRHCIDMVEILSGYLDTRPNDFVPISDEYRECFNTICEEDMKSDIRQKVRQEMKANEAKEMFDRFTEEEIEAVYKVYEEKCQKEFDKGMTVLFVNYNLKSHI